MIREYIYFIDDNPNGTSGMTEEEIIRCKDCKHNYNTCFNHGVNEPMCDFTDRKLKETDFCSFGERRAEQ